MKEKEIKLKTFEIRVTNVFNFISFSFIFQAL